MLFLFLTYLAVIFAIDFTFSNSATTPEVLLQSTNSAVGQQIEEQLTSRNIAIVNNPEQANVLVSQEAGFVTITIDAATRPPWREVWQAVRLSGVKADDIAVFDTEGDWKIDLVRLNLGPALGVGLMAIAFVGTTVPLVAMRERGTLKLLGTTPVTNTALVLSLVPIRIVVAGVEMAIIFAIAVSRNYIDIDLTWRLGLSMLMSLGMLLSLAFLFASKARNASSTQQGMAMLTMLLVSAGGGIFTPLATPVVVQVLFNSIPTTWVMQALGADLSGVTPFIDVSFLWILMTLTACIAFAVSVRTFSWDREMDAVRFPKNRTKKVGS